ncbi:MAG TPA: oligosaccharide flippase family protein [Gemmatirosa sp.]
MLPLADGSAHAPASGGASGSDHDNMLVQSIRRSTRVWFARGVATRVVSLLTNLLLVVLVTPRELGLLAAVRGFIGIVHFATDLGLEFALVRRRADPNPAEMAALSGVRMLCLALIAVGIAVVPHASTLFGTLSPALGGWLIALTAAFAITPTQLGSKVLLERDLQFAKLGTLEVTTVLLENVGLVVAAAVGHFDRGVFLVFIASFCYVTVFVQYLAPLRGLSLNVGSLRPLLRDTVGFSGAALFTVARTSLTPILLAKLFGLNVAGNWALADRVCSYLNLVFESFTRTAFAGAARLRHSTIHLRDLAAHALTHTAMWVIPASVLIFVLFPVLGSLFPKWAGAVQPGQVYVLALGAGGSVIASLSPVTQAMRGPALALVEQAAACLVLWAALAVSAAIGIVNVGLAYAIAIVAQALVLLRLCPPTVRPEMQGLLWTSLVPGAVIVAACVGFSAVGSTLAVRVIAPAILLLTWQSARYIAAHGHASCRATTGAPVATD